MFRRVRNVDLLQHLVSLEKKIDIINSRLDCLHSPPPKPPTQTSPTPTQTSPTPTQTKQDNYFETLLNVKFAELTETIEKRFIKHDVTQHVGALQTGVGALQTGVGALQTDVGALQTGVGALQTDVGALQTDVGALQTDVGALQTDVTAISSKIDSVYFENELIKHQLLLEDEIRNAIEKINSLNVVVNTTISEIDDVISKRSIG